MQILRKHSLNIRKRYLYLIALLFSGIVILQVSSGNQVTTLQGVLRYAVLFVSNYIVWVLLVGYLYGGIRSFQEKGKPWFVRVGEALISLSILITFHLLITNIIYYGYLVATSELMIDEVWRDFQPFILKSLLSRVLDVFIIVVLIKLLEGYWTLQKQKLQVVSLENQLHTSQLEALRAQLDPHFLFNTLHTLHSLIGYDDQKAKSMLIKVTALMRKTLDQRGKHLITLEEELEYIQNYLDIEQERFHDRLEVIFHIDKETKPMKVPALLLQPLIENAFKHGISLLETSGEIHVSSQLENDAFILRVENSIPTQAKSSKIPSGQVGLSNLKDRLDQVYGNDYEFSTNREESFFKVQITIKKPTFV